MYRKLSLILAVLTMSPPVSSQSVVVSAQQRSDVPATEKIVRFDAKFRDEPLSSVLQSISDKTGVDIRFSEQTLPRKLVTYHASNITVEQAIGAVLAGTGMRLDRIQNGGFKVVAQRQVVSVQGVVTGRVIDAKSGQRISGASVSADGNGKGTVTGDDGVYRLAGITAGTHVVSVRLVGYSRQSRMVVVGEGATVNADFRLEPSANVLNQVVVTGTVVQTELKAVPNAITVITAKQVEERGITRIDQLFRGDVPGLFSMNTGSGTFLDEVTMFSRGATALSSASAGLSNLSGNLVLTNPIKTYIDGVEMADSKYLSQIDPKSIERIEILTGPQASTIYGSNAINGVMQIFTKRGGASKPQMSLGISGGVAQNNSSSHLAPSYITDGRVSGTEGKWSYNLGSSWNYVGSWTPSMLTQRLNSSGGSRIDLGKLTADVNARHGLTKNRQSADNRQGLTDLRASGEWSASIASILTTIQSLEGQTVGFSLDLRPYSWWSHEVVLGTDASTTETLKTTPGFGFGGADTSLSINSTTTSRTSERYITTIQLPVFSLSSLNLTVGGDHWRTKGSSVSSNGSSLTGTLGNPSITRIKPSKNAGAFAQGQFSLKDALFFTYGVRADWNPNIGDKARVLPGKYGLSYTHDIETSSGIVSTKLRGSYGRSIRPPNTGQKVAVVTTNSTLLSLFGPIEVQLANPDLGPEHQQGSEGGIELYFGSTASFVVTRYNQTVDNLISLVGSSSASSGPGLDSMRSLLPSNAGQCSSSFRDAEGHCYRYQMRFLNVGSIRNQGWELQSSINIGPFTTRATYSWTKSRVLGVTPAYRAFLTGTEFEPGRSFDYMPEHTWALNITYAHSASSLALFVNGIGARYIQNDALSLIAGSNNRISSNRPRIELPSTIYRPIGSGYATADLNLAHKFSSLVDATFQINNITNYYQNDFSAAYSTIGRQSQTGLRIHW